RASCSAAARGGVVAARQLLPINTHLATYQFSEVELVALRRVAPRPAVQEHPARLSATCELLRRCTRRGCRSATTPTTCKKHGCAPLFGSSELEVAPKRRVCYRFGRTPIVFMSRLNLRRVLDPVRRTYDW